MHLTRERVLSFGAKAPYRVSIEYRKSNGLAKPYARRQIAAIRKNTGG